MWPKGALEQHSFFSSLFLERKNEIQKKCQIKGTSIIAHFKFMPLGSAKSQRSSRDQPLTDKPSDYSNPLVHAHWVLNEVIREVLKFHVYQKKSYP